MKRKSNRALAYSILLLFCGTLVAHHGTSNYDTDHLTTVKGTVTGYEFVNPHVELYFEVKKDNGTVEKWTAEGGSPNMMRRNGWTAKSMKPGDQITVSGNRAKNGSFSMRMMKVILPGGQELIPWMNGGEEVLKNQ